MKRNNEKSSIGEKTKEYSQKYREKHKNDEIYKLKNKIRRQKNYMKKKNDIRIQTFIQNNEYAGYLNRNTLLKKVRSIENQLPKSEMKKIQIVNELSNRYQYNQYNKNKTPNIKPSKTQKIVHKYLNKDYVTIILPGKKDEIKTKNENGETLMIRKRVLKESKQVTFNNFKNEHPNLKISLTTFNRNTPKNVFSFTKMPIYSCLCKIHENFRLNFEGVKEFLINKTSLSTYHDLVKCLVCNTESEICMLHQCSKCKDILNTIKSLVKFTRGQKISFSQWVSDEKSQKKIITLTASKWYENFLKEFIIYKKHSFIAHVQSRYFNHQIQLNTPNCVKIVMDFSENFCVKQQNEIQSAYYSRDQFTLFTAVAYIYLDELKTISYGIVSNTRNHDKYSTNSMKQAILEDLMESYTNIEEIWWFSDGAPAHFKNYYSLSNMTKLAKEYRIKMQWSFSATSHGKSQADGVGGSIKAMIDRRLKTKEIEIKNAKDFYINAKETCPVHKILYVSQEEIDALRDNLDKFWSNAKKIVDLRQFHHFECCENDEKTLKCAITSTGIGQKLVKILK